MDSNSGIVIEKEPGKAFEMVDLKGHARVAEIPYSALKTMWELHLDNTLSWVKLS